MTKYVISMFLLAFSLSASAAPIDIVERFDIDVDEDATAGWTLGGADRVRTRHGNPYLWSYVDTCCLSLRTKSDGSNPWSGDMNYRSLGVIGLRFATIGRTDFPNSLREMGLMLLDNNGTPNIAIDDYGFYHMSGEVYPFDSTGAVFEFVVPSQEVGGVPAGWNAISLGGGPLDFTWDEVITDVDQIQFLYYDPTYLYIWQNHEVGVDNITLTYDTP